MTLVDLGASWGLALAICPTVAVVQSLSHVFCNPMDCNVPGFPVFHCLPKVFQIHVHWLGDAISRSHLLLPSSLFAFNLSQHQDLFQWVSSSHQVAKILELALYALVIGSLLNLPTGSYGKESTCNAGELGLIPGSGRSPGEDNGNPL